MSKSGKIFNIDRKKQLSTLELWQAHLKGLKRASRERRQLAQERARSQASELTIAEYSIRPNQ